MSFPFQARSHAVLRRRLLSAMGLLPACTGEPVIEVEADASPSSPDASGENGMTARDASLMPHPTSGPTPLSDASTPLSDASAPPSDRDASATSPDAGKALTATGITIAAHAAHQRVFQRGRVVPALSRLPPRCALE